MFIKFKNHFCRFLIPISFSLNPLFLSMFSEKVNAQTIELTCDVKTHVQDFESEDWSDESNRIWNLEIDHKNNSVVRSWSVFYKGENYKLSKNYTIFTNNRNKIVAFQDDFTTTQGGISSNSLTLDLVSKKITTANHMNDERGYSFSLHYGKCF